MTGALLVVAFICFALGVATDVIIGVQRRSVRPIPYLLGMAGSTLLLVVGVRALNSAGMAFDLSRLVNLGAAGLLIDHLAGLFLSLLFALGIVVSAVFISWVMPDNRNHRRGIASGYLLLLAAVAGIILAADAFTFMFAWETLTVAFYMLTSVGRDSARGTGAAWSTVGIGKVSGAALLIGFLLMAGRSGSLTIANWGSIKSGTVEDVAWLLVIVGFGAKLGLVPLQVWIPVGYPAAPGPARAAMAGIAANVGVYGLWRFLGTLGRPPIWLVIAVLLVGGVTALLGITFAGVQARLGRVIAYSSIENAGLIVTGYGVALAGSFVGSTPLVAIGLLAATLQAITHAIAKTALFSSLAGIEAAVGTDDLESLRGVGRRRPWSGGAFAVGALTLTGLPPTIGFVSEWFILEALMQQFRLSGLAIRLGLAAAGALVALTTGLAAVAFIRVLGLTILGRPTRQVLESPRETGVFAKAAMVILALSCLGIAALSPWEIRLIAKGLDPIVGQSAILQALKSPWVLQPVFPGFSIVSPSWLWVAMPVAFAAVFVGAIALSGGRYLKVRRVPAWHSATSGVSGAAEYTAFGFANTLRHVLGNILGTTRVTLPIEGDDDIKGEHLHLETVTRVVEPVETYLYRPMRRAALAATWTAKKLQSGRLNAYVSYMLIALLIALALTAALR
ncbi:MAG: proton-conducting transporter membrane subunit [Actinomycetota bacterium]|nr:proton-conducting transporter membrane subunit [Actinomycetota bacterium]